MQHIAEQHASQQSDSHLAALPKQGEPFDLFGSPGFQVRLTWVILPAFAYVLWMTWMLRDTFMDDAYIGFRYVDNLLAGRGFTFNSGLPVEGVTNIGWLLLLVPLGAATTVPLASKLLAPVLLMLTVWLVARLALVFGRQLGSPLYVLPVPLLVVTHPDLMFFSQAGMETALLACGVIWLVFQAVRGQHRYLTAAVGAGLFLVHPEAILIWPLAMVLASGMNTSAWRRQVLPVAIFLAVLLAVTVARLIYFGDVLPNTFAAKSTNWPGVMNRGIQWLAGTNSNISYPVGGLLAVPILIAGLIRIRQIHRAGFAWVLSVLITAFAFAVYARQDWTETGRYFAPYLPVVLMVFWVGLVHVCQLLAAHANAQRLAPALIVVAAAGFTLGGFVRTNTYLHRSFGQQYPEYVMATDALVAPARWMNQALPDDAVIACRRIGALAYHADRDIFDYTFGLADREVASLIQQHGRSFDDPNDPALADLWQEINPDYYLEDDVILQRLSKGSFGQSGIFEIHGLKYQQMRSFEITRDVNWVLLQRLQ